MEQAVAGAPDAAAGLGARSETRSTNPGSPCEPSAARSEARERAALAEPAPGIFSPSWPKKYDRRAENWPLWSEIGLKLAHHHSLALGSIGSADPSCSMV